MLQALTPSVSFMLQDHWLMHRLCGYLLIRSIQDIHYNQNKRYRLLRPCLFDNFLMIFVFLLWLIVDSTVVDMVVWCTDTAASFAYTCLYSLY